MKSKAIYISGAITNLPIALVEDLFSRAVHSLKDLGFTNIISPLDIDHDHDHSWESYMLKDIEVLFNCHSIFMLSNWRESKGARIEHAIALEMGKNIIYQEHVHSGS